MRVALKSHLRRAGFSLPEAMTAVLVVTVACSAMLLSVGQALQASSAGIDNTRANLLAQELMTEISAARWADPAEPTHWGPESGETNRASTREAFDDLDDYDGWAGPPQTRSGQTYDSLQKGLFPSMTSHEYGQYTTSVRVEYVSSTGDVLPVSQTSPRRRVTVQVTQAGQPARKLSRVFEDHAVLLGRSHWFDPKATEPVAAVQIVP